MSRARRAQAEAERRRARRPRRGTERAPTRRQDDAAVAEEAAPAPPTTPATTGRLIIIGGREDKDDERVILREVVQAAARGPLVVVTAASAFPDEVWRDYQVAFEALGAADVVHLPLRSRADALGGPRLEEHLAALARAAGVFFTGGDQLKLTTLLGGTPVWAGIREVFARGGAIAGTSAGASAMSRTMIVHGGDSVHRHRLSEAIHMAPGLGFVDGVIIDQHFGQRGRVSRLLAAVAQNPSVLGVGIDEDTAIAFERPERFRVLGSGAVYVIDGQGISWSNVVEREDRTLSVFDVRLHVLNAGDSFDLTTHRPADPDQVRLQGPGDEEA
ncbi:MAG: cyanophycinase [Planctomycetes bacterium]|nr:cyanophycinase [Planctomycetota bacterium]